MCSYKIITNSKREGFGGSDVSVTRRYSEFSWLAKELSNQFPGVIIPALPEKQAVGRFSSDFVESRQRALEKFLQRCADHPDLGFSKTFLTFLQCDEVTLSRLMTDSKAAKPKMSASAMQWFEGTVTTIQNSGKVRLFSYHCLICPNMYPCLSVLKLRSLQLIFK